MSKGPKPLDVRIRFEKKVDRTGGAGSCHVWTGFRLSGGYGTLGIGSRSDGTRRKEYAHRIAWMLAKGPIPPGLRVLHRCDNPPCVNVSHLFLGSDADNVADMIAKGRRYVGGCVGTANGRATLSEQGVRTIRTSDLDLKTLAAMLGVSPATISDVRRRKTWKHLG